MGKLLFSFLFISCLILVSANVIPNHLNMRPDIAINHLANNNNNVPNHIINANVADKNAESPVSSCIKKCREEGKPGGLCKFNCEQRHLRREKQEQYDDCMKKCQSSAMGEAQSPNVCECRSSCDKSYPKNVWVY